MVSARYIEALKPHPVSRLCRFFCYFMLADLGTTGAVFLGKSHFVL